MWPVEMWGGENDVHQALSTECMIKGSEQLDKIAFATQ